MKIKKYPEDISSFASLSLDGQEFTSNREAATNGTEYVLDTNVIWFLQNPSDAEDSQLQGSAVKYFGRRFVAGNIRKCLEDISEQEGGFKVCRAHNFELEVAVRSELEIDYDEVKDSLKDVFLDVTKKYKSRPNAKIAMAAEIVDNLKWHFQKDFKIVSDILSGRLDKTRTWRTKVSEIHSANSTNDKFLKLSSFLNIVLSVGAERSVFSVRNDIKAIRDIINENISRKRFDHQPELIFLTLDQRLLEACRVAKWLNLPMTEHLLVENCQSFWLWHRDPRHTKNSRLLSRVTNDFLTKSRTILRDIDAEHFGGFSTESRTIFEPQLFKAAMAYLEAYGQSDESDELHLLLARLIDGFREVSFSRKGETHTQLLEALNQFFLEMNQLLPSVQLSISSTEGYEAVLRERLESCGMDQDVFLSALEQDIEEHARKSMEILGASSLLTPRQPLVAFNEYKKFMSAPTRFHRMPVPIQSTVEVVEKIASLVGNEQLSESVRYTELIKIKDLRGLRADLVTAYLAVASGNWKMAEAICTDATFYSGSDIMDIEHAAELNILACSILRIYRTDKDRLAKAQKRLDIAKSMFPESLDQQRKARIESEEMSIRANQFLFASYERSLNIVEYNTQAESAQELLGDLVKHASIIMEYSLTNDVRSKLIANAGVNIVTVIFCSRSDRPKLTKQQLNVISACLKVSWNRICSSQARVSYYEEIVTLFSVRDLNDFDLKSPIDPELLESKRKDKAKYREIALTTTPFEQWVLKHFV